MWDAIAKFATITWNHSSVISRLAFFLFGVVIGLLFISGYREDPAFIDHRILWYSLVLTLYTIGVIPTLIKLSDCRHKYVAHVALLGIISLVVYVASFYLFYFAAIPADADSQSKYERILNFPPVFAGAFAAAIGWYVHHQLTMKIHRTNHSVSLAMQTRTNSEYVANVLKFRAVYHVREDIPATDSEAFSSEATQRFKNERTNLQVQLEKLRLEAQLISISQKSDQTPDAKHNTYKHAIDQLIECNSKIAAVDMKLAKAEAIDGIRYILNFYEFMAYGISAGDLDGDLLLKTIGSPVVNFYNRSAEYRNYIINTTQQKLAFESLQHLINDRNESNSTLDPMEKQGWSKRLEVAGANGNWKLPT